MPVGRLGNGSPFFFMMTLRLPFRHGFASQRNGSGRLFLSRILVLVVLLLVYLTACSPAPTATPFRPPTAEAPLIEPTLIIQPTKQVLVVQSTPLPTIIPTTNPEECFSNLRFISDLTIPDNTFITYGSTIDKQWLVENSGTCHWDATYRLKHLGGADLGAPEEVMLYPARAGTQATVQIIFAAPFTDGVYESAWQAYDADGNPFGDPIYIRITVAAP
jgi:hypothetical protein